MSSNTLDEVFRKCNGELCKLKCLEFAFLPPPTNDKLIRYMRNDVTRCNVEVYGIYSTNQTRLCGQKSEAKNGLCEMHAEYIVDMNTADVVLRHDVKEFEDPPDSPIDIGRVLAEKKRQRKARLGCIKNIAHYLSAIKLYVTCISQANAQGSHDQLLNTFMQTLPS